MLFRSETVPLVRNGERVDAPIRPAFISNMANVLVDALVAGRGIGAAQVMKIHTHLASGALVEVLPDWTYEPMPIHAVYPSSRFIPARVRAFVSFVEGRIKSGPGIR